MRVTKICRQLTGVERLYASDVSLGESGLVFTVRPRWRKPRCGVCGRCAPGYDRTDGRYWRHLGVGATVIWLYYAPWRVDCRRCGVTVEKVTWARHASRFTWALEELVAYMASASINCTRISCLVGISWRAVAGIVRGVVAERVTEARLTGPQPDRRR